MDPERELVERPNLQQHPKPANVAEHDFPQVGGLFGMKRRRRRRREREDKMRRVCVVGVIVRERKRRKGRVLCSSTHPPTLTK